MRILDSKLIRISLVAFCTAISIYICLAFFVGSGVYFDSKVPSDTIIVLGARSYLNGQYNPCLVSRLEQAVKLYKSNFAPKIIVSGGDDFEDWANEAETMRKIALERGVPQDAILVEKKATSTYENLVYSKQIMEREGMKTAIIVTEGFHSARASLVADKLGIYSSMSPATDSSCWVEWKYLSRYFLKEPFAIIQYKFRNRI